MSELQKNKGRHLRVISSTSNILISSTNNSSKEIINKPNLSLRGQVLARAAFGTSTKNAQPKHRRNFFNVE